MKTAVKILTELMGWQRETVTAVSCVSLCFITPIQDNIMIIIAQLSERKEETDGRKQKLYSGNATKVQQSPIVLGETLIVIIRVVLKLWSCCASCCTYIRQPTFQKAYMLHIDKRESGWGRIYVWS